MWSKANKATYTLIIITLQITNLHDGPLAELKFVSGVLEASIMLCYSYPYKIFPQS